MTRKTGVLFFILSVFLAAGLAAALFTGSGPEEDWPMWRYDELRSGSAPFELSGDLHLQWIREMPPPRRAWPWQMDDFEKLAFDQSYSPIVAGGKMFVGSMLADYLAAYSVETGEEIWRYYTDGPVRLSPLYYQGRLYAVADDGYLHCLNAQNGELVWKFRAVQQKRNVLGNERFISMWPARGGPVIKEGTLYFAAGLWPHEGVYIYALDAVNGEVQWVNSGSQSDLIVDSKRYYSFGGVAPQGHFSVQGDQLFVPGGRTPPAVYNRHTGALMFYHVATHSTTKAAGGHWVFPRGDWFFNVRDYRTTLMYTTIDGAHYGQVPVSLTTEEALIGADPATGRIIAHSTELKLRDGETPPEPQIDRWGRPLIDGVPDASQRAPGVSERLTRNVLRGYYELEELWSSPSMDGLKRVHLKAGSTLYGSGEGGRIYAVSLPEGEQPARLLWTKSIVGEVFEMLAANGRLFVVTEEGRIYCFGEDPGVPVTHSFNPVALESRSDMWSRKAADLLEKLDVRGGYGLMYGVGTGRLLDELLIRSDLHMTAYDPDPETVRQLRNKYSRAGLYGERVVVHQGDVFTYRQPPYVASLIVSENPEHAGFPKETAGGSRESQSEFFSTFLHPLRPYGGTAWLAMQQDLQDLINEVVENTRHANEVLQQAEIFREEDGLRIIRDGALPGSASWTHQYGDAGNTAFSPDKRVMAPLGIAWFGGEPNHKALPKHLNGPIPHVVDGRLILLGPHHVSARCVYTGKELWAKELIRVGERFISEEEARFEEPQFPNHPGANFIGSPIISAPDGIYVIYDETCLRLDPATGERLATFTIPGREDLTRHGRDPFTRRMTDSYGARLQEGEQIRWGHIRYSGDYLVVGAYPHMFDDRTPGREGNWNATSSEYIVIMDRYSGEIRWVHQARYGFRHNAIAVGNGRVYVIDNLSDHILQQLWRRGIEPDIEPQIRALDLHSGDVLWTSDREIFGTALAYSEPQDILVQSGHLGRRRPLPDEPRDRLQVLQGRTGEMLWDRAHPQQRSPIGLHTSWSYIIGSTGEGAVNMFTGNIKDRIHPITGKSTEWSWLGALRCGTQNFSEHLVTFRSGAGGFTDLAGGAMTGNITGFRPGCTNNLVVADGMLNVPEYSRGCSCSYQHQTSMGLVYMPDVEMWNYSSLANPEPGAIRKAGINFGAPGNRLDSENQVLWMEYPSLVGPAPEIPIEVTLNGDSSWFRNHSTWLAEPGHSHAWVASYGIRGIEEVRMNLGGPETGSNHQYRVTLYFAEPDNIFAGERVFDIAVQGEPVIQNLDIVHETGSSGHLHRIVMDRVSVQGDLELAFRHHEGSLPAILSGVELQLLD